MRRLALAALVLSACLPGASQASVVGWGFNEHGELGATYKSSPQPPVSVRTSCPVVEVSPSMSSGFALCQDGSVQGWGGNGVGTVGIGTHTQGVVTPVTIPRLTGVRHVYGGGGHAMAVLLNGDVMVWGSNLFGNLGNGTSTHGKEMKGDNVPSPQPVPGLHGACSGALGGPDNVVVLCDGTVVAWGENKSGQLAVGAPSFEVTTPTRVQGASNVVEAAVGAFPAAGGHMILRLADGTLLAAGRNDQGQLGVGTTGGSRTLIPVPGLSGVSSVSADISHSMFLANGTAYTAGDNTYGQLGTGSGPEACPRKPTRKNPATSTACSRTAVAVGLHGVTAISAGFRFSLAIAGGGVFCWGWNLRQSCGVGDSVQRNAPTLVSEAGEATEVKAAWYHALAVVKGAGPPPVVEVTPGPGSLGLHWRAGVETRPWNIAFRPVTHPASPWSPGIKLPVAARDYVLSGLPSVQVEVSIKGFPSFGTRVVKATPLSG